MRPQALAALALFVAAGCSRSSSVTTTPGATSPASATVASPPVTAAPPRTSSLPTDHFATTKGDLAVTPLNHASVLFEWQGKTIYVDPVTPALTDAALPKADTVFITDIHPDHLDPPALERIRKTGMIVVGPQAVADKTHVDVVMANGDTKQVGDVVATAVPMYNVKRGPAPGKLYHDKGRGNGYELAFGDTRVYLSGDTECTPEMKALEKIDVAFVCMNLPYTMPPREAAECIAAFKPKVLFPYHYRGSDLGELDAPLAGKGVEIRKREWYPGQAK